VAEPSGVYRGLQVVSPGSIRVDRRGTDRSTFGIVRLLKQPGWGLGINCSRHVLAKVDDGSRTPGDSKGWKPR
jgi:hypothetical protein